MTRKRRGDEEESHPLPFVEGLVGRLQDGDDTVLPLLASLSVEDNAALAQRLLTPPVIELLMGRVGRALEREAPGVAAEACGVITAWLATDNEAIVRRVYACLVMPKLLGLVGLIKPGQQAHGPILQAALVAIAILIEHVPQAHRQAMASVALWELILKALSVEVEEACVEASLQCLAALLEPEDNEGDEHDERCVALPSDLRERLASLLTDGLLPRCSASLTPAVSLGLSVCWALRLNDEQIISLVAHHLRAPLSLDAQPVELEARLALAELAANVAKFALLPSVCQALDQLASLGSLLACLDGEDPRHDLLEQVERIEERLLHALTNPILGGGGEEELPDLESLWPWTWQRVIGERTGYLPVLQALLMANPQLPVTLEQHAHLISQQASSLLVGLPAVHQPPLRSAAIPYLVQKARQAASLEEQGEALELLVMMEAQGEEALNGLRELQIRPGEQQEEVYHLLSRLRS